MYFANPVYGPENITGGASSDIGAASRLARDMVKVGVLSLGFGRRVLANMDIAQRLGFSKLGPVDYSEDVSPRIQQEIDEEVTRYGRFRALTGGWMLT